MAARRLFIFFYFIFLACLGLVRAALSTYGTIVIDEPVANLSGWSSCYQYSYAQDGVPLSELFSNCTGPNLVLACGQVGVSTFDVLAQTDLAFLSALMSTTGVVDNGASWYRDDGTGIGFTEGGLDLSPCDIDTPGLQTRLCWRLDSSGNLIIGGRCGGNVALNAGDTNFYRELFFDPCRGQSDGTPCDDNNFCTTNTTCQNEVCNGTLIDPPTIGQCEKLGECDPRTGLYDVGFRAPGISCEDGDLCTDTDVCDGSGNCLPGTPVVCGAPPGQCYTNGVCNSTSGNCDYAFRPYGYTCDDGLYCTTPDVCDGSGGCTSTGNRTCVSVQDCREPGVCNEALDQCEYPVSPDGTACFIANLCVNTSICVSGTCVPDTGVICPPPNDCQVSSTCNSNTGQCEVVNKLDGTSCNDTDLCTLSDQCLSGQCIGTAVTCTALGQCYDVGTCNPATGLCSNPPSPSTRTCTDGNACTDPDMCDGAGSCIPGSAVTCSAIGQCDVASSCNPSVGCVFTPKADGSLCDDGNVCTLDDYCQSGTCQAGDFDNYNIYCFPNYMSTGSGTVGNPAARLPNCFSWV